MPCYGQSVRSNYAGSANSGRVGGGSKGLGRDERGGGGGFPFWWVRVTIMNENGNEECDPFPLCEHVLPGSWITDDRKEWRDRGDRGEEAGDFESYLVT